MCLPWFKKSNKKSNKPADAAGPVTSDSLSSLKHQPDSIRKSPTSSIKTLPAEKPLHLASKTTPDTSHKTHVAKPSQEPLKNDLQQQQPTTTAVSKIPESLSSFNNAKQAPEKHDKSLPVLAAKKPMSQEYLAAKYGYTPKSLTADPTVDLGNNNKLSTSRTPDTSHRIHTGGFNRKEADLYVDAKFSVSSKKQAPYLVDVREQMSLSPKSVDVIGVSPRPAAVVANKFEDKMAETKTKIAEAKEKIAETRERLSLSPKPVENRESGGESKLFLGSKTTPDTAHKIHSAGFKPIKNEDVDTIKIVASLDGNRLSEVNALERTNGQSKDTVLAKVETEKVNEVSEEFKLALGSKRTPDTAHKIHSAGFKPIKTHDENIVKEVETIKPCLSGDKMQESKIVGEGKIVEPDESKLVLGTKTTPDTAHKIHSAGYNTISPEKETSVGGNGESRLKLQLDEANVKPSLPKPIIKPVESEPIVKTVGTEPLAKPVVPEPIIKSVELEQIIKPITSEPIVKPDKSEPIVKPVEQEPIFKSVESVPIVKPMEFVKPMESKPIVKPVEPEPIVKPAEQEIVKPVESVPIVKQVEQEPIVKPVEPEPIVKPAEQEIVKPVESVPIVKPVEQEPIFKPVEPEPIVKPVESKPIVEPVEPELIVKPVESEPTTVFGPKVVEPIGKLPKQHIPVNLKPKALEPKIAVEPQSSTEYPQQNDEFKLLTTESTLILTSKLTPDTSRKIHTSGYKPVESSSRTASPSENRLETTLTPQIISTSAKKELNISAVTTAKQSFDINQPAVIKAPSISSSTRASSVDQQPVKVAKIYETLSARSKDPSYVIRSNESIHKLPKENKKEKSNESIINLLTSNRVPVELHDCPEAQLRTSASISRVMSVTSLNSDSEATRKEQPMPISYGANSGLTTYQQALNKYNSFKTSHETDVSAKGPLPIRPYDLVISSYRRSNLATQDFIRQNTPEMVARSTMSMDRKKNEYKRTSYF